MGDRSVMFFLVQRMDAERFQPADRIDEKYGIELRKAIKNGVEIMVYDVSLDLKSIALNRALPFDTADVAYCPTVFPPALYPAGTVNRSLSRGFCSTLLTVVVVVPPMAVMMVMMGNPSSLSSIPDIFISLTIGAFLNALAILSLKVLSSEYPFTSLETQYTPFAIIISTSYFH